ncbi:MAG: molybdopterin converting factor subunit 1 [Acidobacteriota bacterium]
MLKLRFFASLKDLIGKSEMDVELETETSVREILQRLETRFPRLEQYEPILLVAVNQEYSNLDALVSPGDEVSFFPPVSGGSR